ncbi:MAG: peptide chain release factor N(5)-glutamine methyltransferase [Candidatus Omnitrophica bacterium]|nr:peptide chain release factor N(5)-glutamine methyltransferase [Candidatus Omnitrophota bacterium]
MIPPSTLHFPSSRHDVRQVIRDVEQKLREGGVASARAEAEWLAAEAYGVTRTELYLADAPVDPLRFEQIEGWVARRLRGEPLQHVVGSAEFYGHRLAVSPDVLIPRPETEALVEQAEAFLRQRVERTLAPTVLDLGTGSGTIAISLALAVPSCVVVAVELSWNALCVARANLQQFHLEDRLHLIQADWTRGVGGAFDLVISNPPYVPRAEVERLPDEVRSEPRLSLDGGEDGMSPHRRLVAEIPRLLRRGGVVCMECGGSQAEPLRDLVHDQPWVDEMRVIDDLAGRPRGLWVVSKACR